MNNIKRLTFDDVCRYHNSDGSIKEGIKKFYVSYPFPSKITMPDMKEAIGYFSGKENLWGHCVYYKVR